MLEVAFGSPLFFAQVWFIACLCVICNPLGTINPKIIKHARLVFNVFIVNCIYVNEV